MDKALFVGNIFSSTLRPPDRPKNPYGRGASGCDERVIIKIENRRAPSYGSELRATSYELRASSYELRLRATSYGSELRLRATAPSYGSELRASASSYELRASSFELRQAQTTIQASS